MAADLKAFLKTNHVAVKVTYSYSLSATASKDMYNFNFAIDGSNRISCNLQTGNTGWFHEDYYLIGNTSGYRFTKNTSTKNAATQEYLKLQSLIQSQLLVQIKPILLKRGTVILHLIMEPLRSQTSTMML